MEPVTAPVTSGSSMDNKWLWAAGGAAATLLAISLYLKKRYGSANFKTALSNAKDEGYNEAHENIRQLLVSGHNAGITPGDCLAVMEGKLKVA